jgi:pimeloyl-ACP methyl ester carboxylesterase
MVDPVDATFVSEFQASTIHRPVTPEFFDKVVEESLKVRARVWRAALSQLVDIKSPERYRRIACPTHILWGDQDSTFLRDEQEELSRVIPDATLEVVHGIGHAVHWEAPEFVAQRLRSFVRA